MAFNKALKNSNELRKNAEWLILELEGNLKILMNGMKFVGCFQSV